MLEDRQILLEEGKDCPPIEIKIGKNHDIDVLRFCLMSDRWLGVEDEKDIKIENIKGVLGDVPATQAVQ